MAVNSNYGATVPNNTKGQPIGIDNPGSQTCPNCNKTVIPRAVNGIRKGNTAEKNDGKAAFMGTAAGYHCTSCGHNFNWIKSTVKAGGPAFVGKTNQTGVADM